MMDATESISAKFDRLAALGPIGIGECSAAERLVFYVAVTRCEIDINGFASVFEQALTPAELEVLITGLRTIGEADLAANLRRAFELLDSNGFYGHMSWSKMPPAVTATIDAIGQQVGARLWDRMRSWPRCWIAPTCDSTIYAGRGMAACLRPRFRHDGRA